MKKIKITVCCGTTCFLMGSSDILALEELLPLEISKNLEFEGSPCMDFCKSKQAGKAPFVIINEELISSANQDIIKARILELMKDVAL